MDKLTIEQIMGLQSKQKFFVADEDGVESYYFVAFHPLVTTLTLIIAISHKGVVTLDANKNAWFLNYKPALVEFVRLAQEKVDWWKAKAEEL